jgi:hypothetical protein
LDASHTIASPAVAVWIGFAQGFLNTPDGKNMLDLSAASVPVAPIIVGHPRAAPAPVPRNQPQIRWVG